jgi:hypothetical protein
MGWQQLAAKVLQTLKKRVACWGSLTLRPPPKQVEGALQCH